MNHSMPQMSPAGNGGYASASAGNATQMPSAEPPAGVASAGSAGCGCNGAGAGAGAASAPPPALLSSNDAGPTLQVAADGAAAAIGAWNNGKRITALWTINQNRNSWAHVDGVGWKRLSTASESGVVALTRLAAHARERNSVVNYRDEADGMVHEIYVW
ncbi:MAG: hypothetical protein KF683_22485 [Rubrivivax sp.]|nr:hypothetical protein [Rubrivivax sp.]